MMLYLFHAPLPEPQMERVVNPGGMRAYPNSKLNAALHTEEQENVHAIIPNMQNVGNNTETNDEKTKKSSMRPRINPSKTFAQRPTRCLQQRGYTNYSAKTIYSNKLSWLTNSAGLKLQIPF